MLTLFWHQMHPSFLSSFFCRRDAGHVLMNGYIERKLTHTVWRMSTELAAKCPHVRGNCRLCARYCALPKAFIWNNTHQPDTPEHFVRCVGGCRSHLHRSMELGVPARAICRCHFHGGLAELAHNVHHRNRSKRP